MWQTCFCQQEVSAHSLWMIGYKEIKKCIKKTNKIGEKCIKKISKIREKLKKQCPHTPFDKKKMCYTSSLGLYNVKQKISSRQGFNKKREGKHIFGNKWGSKRGELQGTLFQKVKLTFT